MKQWKKYLPVYLILLLALLATLFWYALLREERGGLLTVSFLDVGQGDAIFIEAPSGKQIIIDGGPDTSLVRQLGSAMPFYDRTIDMLVVTNPDKDHFAGFIDALLRYRVGEIVEPGTQTASAIYATFRERVADEGAQTFLPKTGDRIVLDEKRGITLDVLFPDRDVSGLDTNDGSLVTRLSYGEICFLLMGDAPRGVEEYLTHLYGDYLHCAVLKVGHHGSRTSSSEFFVQKVAPQYAVISDGKDNSYGHPHQETLDTLKEFGVNVLRTDTLGTITFETDGVELWKRK